MKKDKNLNKYKVIKFKKRKRVHIFNAETESPSEKFIKKYGDLVIFIILIIILGIHMKKEFNNWEKEYKKETKWRTIDDLKNELKINK